MKKVVPAPAVEEEGSCCAHGGVHHAHGRHGHGRHAHDQHEHERHGHGWRRRSCKETSLRECLAGDCVEVVEILSNTSVSVRMREIGIMRDACLRVIRSGTPMIVQVGNTRFCLRDNEAAIVQVRAARPCACENTADASSAKR